MTRRFLFALVATVLAVAMAIPAVASAMPPKEAALMKSLKARGVIPKNAPAATQQLAYQLYLAGRFNGAPEERGNPLAQRAATEGESRGISGAASAYNGQPEVETEKVLVLLVEFAGSDDGPSGTTSGPLHNEISQPTGDDNTTYWIPDFSADHYRSMLFDQSFGAKSFSNYFLEQSGGTYMPVGDVTSEWVTVPHSEAYYGANDPSGDGDDLNGPVWRVVQDAVAEATDVNWSDYDVQDPYDLDNDEDIDEPDGYVDHLMVIHAGAGEEAGGGAQGEDAIWSHSWWADYGNGGPGYGGVPTSEKGVWVGPYTIEPEDGTVGVFVHEFAHDLGLPDQYDTIYSGESSTGFWTLMSSGSWLGAPGAPLGTSPSALSAWEKWALGWSEPTVVYPGDPVLEQPLRNTSAAGTADKAIKVQLPEKDYSVYITDPLSGTFWYSGSGDNLDATLGRDLAVPADDPTLRFWTWYDIEADYDYGYVQVTTVADPGPGDWQTIPSSIAADGTGGISGQSDGWVQASYDLSAYQGMTVTVRLRYLTDGGLARPGWAVDEMSLGAFSDDGTSDVGWTVDGWTTSTGYDTYSAIHYYIAEWRQASGFDVSMNSWYNYPDPYSNKAQFFRASPGMLVWYRDTQYADNWVLDHPWAGQLSLVDANPTLVTQRASGYPTRQVPFRTRIQLQDAAFGRSASISNGITRWGKTVRFSGKPAVPTFDDTRNWADTRFGMYIYDWSAYGNAVSSVMTPGYGAKLTVKRGNRAAAVIKTDFTRGRVYR
ncbi:MAG: M6 family metalloprotease domain-containing protein [Coriobacteriia bacterium]|nr:M6 family metalloprotease domain-containing protein [Coriobacteriia bacterium]